ncbi:MAG: hypothetical protein II916_05705 [Oscillospiraceae bacterium]|nr:hypothetical protein [Oscillospiraceae bacterium]
MFYERLKTLCKENGTSVSKMLTELKLSTGSTGAWKRGQLPKGETLAAIADYLHTSIDFLIFGEYRCNLNEEQLHLLELYESTPEYARYKVMCDFEDSVTREVEKFRRKRSE